MTISSITSADIPKLVRGAIHKFDQANLLSYVVQFFPDILQKEHISPFLGAIQKTTALDHIFDSVVYIRPELFSNLHIKRIIKLAQTQDAAIWALSTLAIKRPEWTARMTDFLINTAATRPHAAQALTRITNIKTELIPSIALQVLQQAYTHENLDGCFVDFVRDDRQIIPWLLEQAQNNPVAKRVLLKTARQLKWYFLPEFSQELQTLGISLNN